MRSCFCKILGYFPVEIIVLKSRHHFSMLETLFQLYYSLYHNFRITAKVAAKRRIKLGLLGGNYRFTMLS
jgi:hypothetical protein